MVPAGLDQDGALGLTVVLPVYRNADTLPALHAALHRVLDAQPLDYELLFVDDACPAGSLRVLESLAARDPRVAVLALDRNVGQHRAILAGVELARGARIVVMDADLQDPPEAIPALLARLAQGPDAVFAGRRGRYESPPRLLSSWLLKRLLWLLCGLPPDAGAFLAIHRELAL